MGKDTIIEVEGGRKTIITDEDSATKVPFVDKLGIDADKLIQERVSEWRAEGKKIDLEYSIICLQVCGADLPEDLDSVKVVVGGRGSVGERLSSEEFLGHMSELVAEISETSGRRDPFQMLHGLHTCFNGFVEDLRPIAEERTARGRIGALIERFRGRDTKALVEANNKYMRAVQYVVNTGSIEVPGGEGAEGVEGLDGLSREDFDG